MVVVVLGTVLWISRGLAHYSVSDLSLSFSIYLERVSFHTPRNKLLYLKSLITARIRFLRYTAMRISPSFRKNGGHTLIFFSLSLSPGKMLPSYFLSLPYCIFFDFFSLPLFLFFFLFRNVTQRSTLVYFVPRLGEKEKEKKGDVSTLYRNPSSFFFWLFFWLLYRW